MVPRETVHEQPSRSRPRASPQWAGGSWPPACRATLARWARWTGGRRTDRWSDPRFHVERQRHQRSHGRGSRPQGTQSSDERLPGAMPRAGLGGTARQGTGEGGATAGRVHDSRRALHRSSRRSGRWDAQGRPRCRWDEERAGGRFHVEHRTDLTNRPRLPSPGDLIGPAPPAAPRPTDPVGQRAAHAQGGEHQRTSGRGCGATCPRPPAGPWITPRDLATGSPGRVSNLLCSRSECWAVGPTDRAPEAGPGPGRSVVQRCRCMVGTGAACPTPRSRDHAAAAR